MPMDWDSPAFVIVIVAMVMVTAILSTWIQARAKSSDHRMSRKARLLEQENSNLKEQVGKLEERLAVLERIATDPAELTARKIEQLR
jgi:uncharacterized protein YlxW (UPF0749 family)